MNLRIRSGANMTAEAYVNSAGNWWRFQQALIGGCPDYTRTLAGRHCEQWGFTQNMCLSDLLHCCAEALTALNT